jgi:hypothetical protein
METEKMVDVEAAMSRERPKKMRKKKKKKRMKMRMKKKRKIRKYGRTMTAKKVTLTMKRAINGLNKITRS